MKIRRNTLLRKTGGLLILLEHFELYPKFNVVLTHMNPMINIKITIYSPCICCIQILLHPLRLGSWSAGSGGFQAADGREGAKCNLSLQWSVWRFGLIIWNIWVLDNIHNIYIYIHIIILCIYILYNTIVYTTMHICIVMYIYILYTHTYTPFWHSPILGKPFGTLLDTPVPPPSGSFSL